MPRAKNRVASRSRRKALLNEAKGFRGRRKNLIRTVKDAVSKAGQYAYRDRKVKKREFRKLWIIRINAAARLNGMTYSELMNKLKNKNIVLNRKMLADMAVRDPQAFAKLAETVK